MNKDDNPVKRGTNFPRTLDVPPATSPVKSIPKDDISNGLEGFRELIVFLLDQGTLEAYDPNLPSELYTLFQTEVNNTITKLIDEADNFVTSDGVSYEVHKAVPVEVLKKELS